jgi:photosystem II stability/assembly factor-like uncharacterized protein
MKKTLLSILGLVTLATAVAQQTPSPSWTISQNAAFPIPSAGVRFLDAVSTNTVWLAGYDGANAARNYNYWSNTTNGGTTYTSGLIWTSTLTPAIGDTSTYKLANIEGVDGNTAWVSAYLKASNSKGAVFKTTNGGGTWVNMNSAAMFTNTAAFTDFVSFLTPSVGIALGDPVNGEFEIWRSTNAGATWSAIPGASIPNPLAGEYGLVNIYTKLGANSYWYGTNQNRIYRSTDAGLTWSVSAQLTSTIGPVLGINDIAFTDANNGLASAYFGPMGTGTVTLWKTTDGGASWNMIPSVDPNFGLNDFCNIEGTSWYASCGAGAGNNILSFSQDNGVTWNDWGSTNIQYLYIDFINSSTGWVGSFSSPTLASQGGIYKYSGANLFQPANANAAFSMTATACTSVAVNVNNTSAGAPVPNYTWSSAPAANISNTSAIAPSITFSATGVYTISLAANNGGTTSTTTHTINITACGVGMAEHNMFEQSIGLYPNPANDKINIEVSNTSSYSYKITDLLGKVVVSDKVSGQSNTSVNLSSINKGIYFLTVESNGQKATRKIIIE